MEKFIPPLISRLDKRLCYEFIALQAGKCKTSLLETLGIRIYSSQELSYVIYHYPLLVMEDFVGEGLLEFMREELNQGFLALKV